MYLKPKCAEIRAARKLSGLSQIQLSEKAGFGKRNTAICRLEQGTYKVHPLRAKAVADVLGYKVNDLFEPAS